jgi:hypothetical protein
MAGRGRAPYASIMRVAALVMATVIGSGCAETSGNGKDQGQYLAVVSSQGATQVKMDSTGRVFGPDLDLITTRTGYRGAIAGLPAVMDSDGEHIVGSVGGRVVDLRLSGDDVSLQAAGQFAGRLGKIEVSPGALKSSFGRCSYDLQNLDAARFRGQRACGGNLANLVPVTLELPSNFRHLPPDRQVMMLALLLGA